MVCSDGGLRKIDLQEQKLTVNDAIHEQCRRKECQKIERWKHYPPIFVLKTN
jgi:hypothetical protein